MSEAFSVRIEWLDAPGVSAPELAATWARYSVWVHGQCVTQVEDKDGSVRRSLYGSLYPLAEWVATNWWLLRNNLRPSAIETSHWNWSTLRRQPWLTHHNFRAAGDGMAWPNLTLVPEGDMTRAVWLPDRGGPSNAIRFVSVGDAWLPSDDVSTGLAMLVDHVLDRLAESGLPNTSVADEWSAIGAADDEERDFCQAVARLGLDPYAIDDEMSAAVVAMAERVAPDLLSDFFDNADPAALELAERWTSRALRDAASLAGRADNALEPLYAATNAAASACEVDYPWETGYQMARAVRLELGVPATDRFDVAPWVASLRRGQDAAGIQGVVAVAGDQCGLVQAGGHPRFGQARALGRVLAQPDRRTFMLSAARSPRERVAGAFAAELLAPAFGIASALATLGGPVDDTALDAVAEEFEVSPLVIRHQYENQLADA